MKKILFPVLVTLFTTTMMLTSCESTDKKVEDARQDVTDAQAKLEQAKQDSAAEYVKAKAEWSAQIVKNQQDIDSFKAMVVKEKKEQKEKDEMKIKQLETRNAELKESMEEFKDDGKESWKQFETRVDFAVDEFNREISNIGTAIKNSVDADFKKK